MPSRHSQAADDEKAKRDEAAAATLRSCAGRSVQPRSGFAVSAG